MSLTTPPSHLSSLCDMDTVMVRSTHCVNTSLPWVSTDRAASAQVTATANSFLEILFFPYSSTLNILYILYGMKEL